MNHTFSRTASEPISERDAAWFEELAESLERARVVLLARPEVGIEDTALSLIALADAGEASTSPQCEAIIHWLLKRAARQEAANETAAVLIALGRSGHTTRAACAAVVHDSINWLLEVQNRDGGWPEANAGGPSCPTITGRVLEALGHFGFRVGQPPIRAAVKWLLTRQGDDGSWADEWQIFLGLDAVGFDMTSLVVRRAVRCLKESQNEDGGWGGNEEESTAQQTAFGLIGLLTVGEAESAEVRAGAEFLIGTQRAEGSWNGEVCFPLMALGRYARAMDVMIPHGPPQVLSQIPTGVCRGIIPA